MKKTIFFFILISYSSLLSAQCSVCVDALKIGVKDEFFKETRHNLDESVNTLYAYDYEFWENYENSSSKSSSFDAAYKIFSASFSSSNSSSEKKEVFNKQKTSYLYSRSLVQNDYEKISQSLISKVAYTAFSDCVKSNCGNGLFIDYETTGEDIIITVRLVITVGQPKATVLKINPTVANAVPINYNFQQGVSINPNSSISALYRRINPKQDAVFSFDFEYYPTKQVIVKRSRHQNIELPVGTIVASVLDYSTYCSINEIEISNDMSNVTWVPADGRDVTGSLYGGRQKNIPDLRGTFLRGANVFDENFDPPFKDLRQKDPENRKSNKLQFQDVQPHTHAVNDPGHSHSVSLAIIDVGDSGTVAYRPGGFGTPATLGADSSLTGITIKSNESIETRPTNLSVYYYIKIN